MQLNNGKDWPEVYSCKFLEAGVVSYEDSGAGIALLKRKEIIMRRHEVVEKRNKKFKIVLESGESFKIEAPNADAARELVKKTINLQGDKIKWIEDFDERIK